MVFLRKKADVPVKSLCFIERRFYGFGTRGNENAVHVQRMCLPDGNRVADDNGVILCLFQSFQTGGGLGLTGDGDNFYRPSYQF